MAGSISLSLSQQFDELGDPLNGGLLYFYAAGTTTPQSAYQDVALTLPYPNPIVLDSAGRVPPFYLADGQIKIRLTNDAGVVQLAADNLLVVGASSGSGSPPSVDATTILATGDLKWKYGTGALSGFVRLNGRTIGSASSGGTERANADCQSLFEYLWAADSTLSVSTGRGISANADWVANKNIALPDFAGCVIAGLDDMGAGAKSRLTASGFGPNATVLGTRGGLETNSVILTHNHTLTDPGHNHTTNKTYLALVGADAGSFAFAPGSSAVPAVTNNSNTTGITIAPAGSASAHNIVQPTAVTTIYMKL